LFGQAGEDEFAELTVGQGVSGLGGDDLGVEVVFPDVQAVLGFEAFLGHAGTDDLGDSVDVDGVDVEALFEGDSQLASPWFCAEDADFG
jgi:hypothetical protein